MLSFIKKISLLFLLSLTHFSFSQSDEQLIVFIGDDAISQHFKTSMLEKVKAYTNENAIELKLVSISEGAPEEVVITPSFFYQNYRGRSLYSGRYLTLDRLVNFIRTAKYSPRKTSENQKEFLPIWKNGRAIIGTPLKVTPLNGALPDGFDQTQFIEEAKKSIQEGLSDFKTQASFDLPSYARLFYTDYHPYLSEDGKLYITTAIFSMFHCHESVYQSETPISGDWNNRSEVFKQAAQLMETEVKKQLSDLRKGDAFTPVSNETPTKSWEELGLALPQKKLIDRTNFKLTTLPTTWQFDQGLPDGSPVVQFSFGAPVDHYSGEAKAMRMQIELASGTSLQGAKGHVVVKTSSVTMGDAGLDDYIFTDLLKTGLFPNTTYSFTVVEAPESWNFLTPQPIKLKGTFDMIGKAVELEASGTVEVVLDENAQPRLRVNGGFILPLKKLFGIDGPDGPSPAKDELEFQLNFLMKPAQQVVTLTDDLFLEKTKEKKKQKIVEGEYIKWRASVNLYKARGSFEEWRFEKLELPASDFTKVQAELTIIIASLNERSKLLVKHLKAEEYFHEEAYPTAKVVIDGATQLEENKYRANAKATIKGITSDIELFFEVVDQETLEVKGTATIEREKFTIGTSRKARSITKLVELDFRAFLKDKL